MANETQIRRRLQGLIDLDFEYTSLDNVLKYIGEVTGLNIVVDPDVAASGIDLASRVVSLKVQAEPVETVLDLVLGADLAYKVKSNHVLITTKEKFFSDLPVRSYAVDFLEGVNNLEEGADYAPAVVNLLDVIQRTVNHFSDAYVADWAEAGGTASIGYVSGKLVVSQTERGHEKIEQILRDLRLDQRRGVVMKGPNTRTPREPKSDTGHDATTNDPPRIFISHGHDKESLHAVESFLRKIGMDPVILEERADLSLTAVEKFEKDASRVDFAVVLLTPDDVGAARKTIIESDRDRNTVPLKDLLPRARQNVIFELGFFVAKLGREHMCVLRKGDLGIVAEVSNWHGVICAEIDRGGGWKQRLALALRTAGVPFDPNKVLE